MKAKLYNQDLKKQYRDNQDPIFHIGESWKVAEGDGWVAVLATRGEVRATYKGERLSVDSLIQILDTDDKLTDAENCGDLEFGMNNWYELEFYTDLAEREYLDLLSDDCVCYDFVEANYVLKSYLKDPAFEIDLGEAIRRAGENILNYLKDKEKVCDLDKEERLLIESVKNTLDKWD